MNIFLITVDVFFFAALLFVTAILPVRSRLSHYELKRRAGLGSGEAIQKLRREKLLNVFEALQNAKISALLVLIAALSIAAIGWFWGIVCTLIIALTYDPLASLDFIHKPAQKLYERYESTILAFIEKYANIFQVFGAKKYELTTSLHSKEELQHTISQAHFLNLKEKEALIAAIHFSSLKAKDIMTTKEKIDSIGKNEMLGPLVLDQLHKTGHSCFPVFAGSPDNIVGILDIKDIVSLKDKQSHMVRTVMHTHVHRIGEQQSVEATLADFLHHRSHLFIVVDENEKIAGVLSMKDVAKTLLGRTAKTKSNESGEKEHHGSTHARS